MSRRDTQPSTAQHPVGTVFSEDVLCSWPKSQLVCVKRLMAKPTLENEVKILTTCLVYNVKISNLLIGCAAFFEKTSSSISMHSYFFFREKLTEIQQLPSQIPKSPHLLLSGWSVPPPRQEVSNSSWNKCSQDSQHNSDHECLDRVGCPEVFTVLLLL